MLAPILTQDIAEEAARCAASLIPFSCSTNLANEVNDHLRQAKLTARAWEVCSYLLRQTFGNAGWHRKQGREEWWCAFDLARWAAVLGCDRSNLRRTLAELVACQIICFEPDLTHPGEGRIGWNLTFGAWRTYDQCRQRYVGSEQAGVVRIHHARTQEVDVRNREGSEQARMVRIPLERAQKAEAPGDTEQEQASMVRMAPCEASQTEGSGEQGQNQASVVNMLIPSIGGGEAAHDMTMLACPEEEGKLTTLGCSEEPLHQGSVLPVRNGLRKKVTETPLVVSEAPSASLDAGLGSSSDPLDATSRASNNVHATPPAADAPGAWPPRQAWEHTDLDYFQRVLRDNEKARVALLTRLAHERIGVPMETVSYARIGALAKQCGAALLVKHILLAAANHIDGDPLNYLTKLASRQQQKEHPDGDRSQARPSATQPYTAEEAAQLTWKTL